MSHSLLLHGRPGALLLAACLACSSDPAPPRATVPDGAPRGVLVISIDSLRADHLSSYGYESVTAPGVATTPVLDARLAAEGARFTNAVSTTSWTVPGHMAMLGGQPDRMHGVLLPNSKLHPARRLLAQPFQEAGWSTAGFYSGPNLDAWFGFGRGFDHYEDCTSVGVEAARFEAATPEERKLLRAMEDASHEGLTGELVAERFGEWFDGLAHGAADEEREPFFAFVHFWDVHYDYAPPAEHDLFDPDYQGTVDGTGIPQLDMSELADPERDRDHILALYDGELHYTDANIGRMLDQLGAAGRLDDTLVIVTSDHGEEFGEHGRFGHNKTLFEESIEVPLLVRWPGRIPAGTRYDDLVSLVDLAPTVLDLVGFEREAEHWGRSLAPLFAGEDLRARVAPLELAFGRPDPELPRAAMEGLHAGDHKVIRNRPGTKPVVYDLSADPLEQSALGVEPSDPRVEAAKDLWKRIEEIGARLPRVDGELPSELEDSMGHFGYLGDD
ncbi:MAG: sulfatase [Planctomycetota bacterium]|nr:sulfatase [Planctomycetota bacterium]